MMTELAEAVPGQRTDSADGATQETIPGVAELPNANGKVKKATPPTPEQLAREELAKAQARREARLAIAELTPVPAGLLPSPESPMRVARALQPRWERDGMLTLRHWQGAWWRWHGSHWREYADADFRAWLYHRLEKARFWFIDGRSGIGEVRAWDPTRGKLANLSEAVAAIANVPHETELGSWLDGRTAAGLVIPCANGLLDLATRELMPTSPLFFNTSAVPFAYDPAAPMPARWLSFLNSVWPDDPEAISALQEWAGYIISGRRDLHKILVLVGPTRSGKGTISKVLTALVGEAHTASPTLAKFAEPFGLASLIGKGLAIVPDARMPREGAGIIVENLLMISGQDNIDVNRKHREAWSGRLPVQLMIVSNELPHFPDASTAIAGRAFILRMVNSFYGREDLSLQNALMSELPSIFNWSLEGLDRLTQRGRFIEPESSREGAELMRTNASPVAAFIADRCVLDPAASVVIDALYTAYHEWCRREGRDHVETKPKFGAGVFAAAPKVRKIRSREYPGGPQIWTYEGIRLKQSHED